MKKIKLVLTIMGLSVIPFSAVNVSAAQISYTYNNTTASSTFNYEDRIYGNAKYHNEGVAETNKRCTEDNYINSYTYLDKYKYVVYKYDKALASRVKRLHDNYYYVAKGNYKDVTASVTKTITDTYEKSVSESISVSATVKSKAEASDGLNKVAFESSATSTMGVVATIGESHSYSYAAGYSTTDHLEAIDSDKNYSWELRANFDVYVAFLYEINYKQTITKKKTWYGKTYHTYSYSVESLGYVECMYYYQLISDSTSEGFFPYSYVTDKYMFAGEKNSNLVYLD